MESFGMINIFGTKFSMEICLSLHVLRSLLSQITKLCEMVLVRVCVYG